jgi:hypothetical protein
VGSLRVVDGKAVVRMEHRFSTDIDDLWPALTDPQRLARWIAIVDGDLRLGGEFWARFTSGWEGPPGGWTSASPTGSKTARDERHEGGKQAARGAVEDDCGRC